MISGLSMTTPLEEQFLELYIATIVALACGTRAIVDAMNENGLDIETIYACGGVTANKLYVQAQANATGCDIHIPEHDAMLVGTAALAATAAELHPSLLHSMSAMTNISSVVEASKDDKMASFFENKYQAMIKLQALQQSL
eukprot:TRINITY_DN10562_c0_g1_i2.p2 TRINITY_DN10562_c0_g1~~TRINITY_DN10562_c0_g1_i2.p2  ORF type:complete len:141 (+),score=31.40 TRINITY_DN10562_c0_g1_i2:1297-1719(+)